MYFGTYKRNKIEEIGVVLKEQSRIVPMKEIFKYMDRACPETMNEFIEIADANTIQEVEKVLSDKNLEGLKEGEVKLCAPIPNPRRNLICLGKNYLDHAKETQGLPGGTDEIPKFPIYFLTFPPFFLPLLLGVIMCLPQSYLHPRLPRSNPYLLVNPQH